MTVFEAILLGIVQGLTEFLPISSSGHLVIVPELLNMDPPPLAFDVLLHLATALAIVGYFGREVYMILVAFVSPKRLSPKEVKGWRRMGLWLVIGSLPIAAAGFFFRGFFEALFDSTLAVGALLMLTGCLMLVADIVASRGPREKRVLKDMGAVDALIIGLFQALAVAPGLSRSGSTISAGVYVGLERRSAARFSFLLGVPAILGAGLVNIGDISVGLQGSTAAAFALGALAAVVSSLLAVHFMLRFLRRHRLRGFVIYVFALGAVVVGLSLL
jgi:undecaprenyl-diphosphatase